jgi:hypothetical protein
VNAYAKLFQNNTLGQIKSLLDHSTIHKTKRYRLRVVAVNDSLSSLERSDRA